MVMSRAQVFRATVQVHIQVHYFPSTGRPPGRPTGLTTTGLPPGLPAPGLPPGLPTMATGLPPGLPPWGTGLPTTRERRVAKTAKRRRSLMFEDLEWSPHVLCV